MITCSSSSPRSIHCGVEQRYVPPSIPLAFFRFQACAGGLWGLQVPELLAHGWIQLDPITSSYLGAFHNLITPNTQQRTYNTVTSFCREGQLFVSCDFFVVYLFCETLFIIVHRLVELYPPKPSLIALNILFSLAMRLWNVRNATTSR